jgi:hypothetical protein
LIDRGGPDSYRARVLRSPAGECPELAGLPWEFLYDPRHNRFLAQSRHSPLVRYLDLPDPPQPLSVEGPLRVSGRRAAAAATAPAKPPQRPSPCLCHHRGGQQNDHWDVRWA